MNGRELDGVTWVKSSLSYSNGQCAEVAARRVPSASMSNGQCAEAGAWRRSSASTWNGECAEAGTCGHGVAVRDSKDRDGPVLLFGPAAWARFLRDLK